MTHKPTIPPTTVGEELAHALTNCDWSRIVLEISARKGWRVSTIARQLNCNAVHLRRLARGDVMEPRITLAIRLLDLHADVMNAQTGELTNDQTKRD